MRNQKLARAIKRARGRGFERGWCVAYVIEGLRGSYRVLQSPQDVSPEGLLRPDVVQTWGPMKMWEATAEKKRLVSEGPGSRHPSAPAE